MCICVKQLTVNVYDCLSDSLVTSEHVGHAWFSVGGGASSCFLRCALGSVNTITSQLNQASLCISMAVFLLIYLVLKITMTYLIEWTL